MGLFTRKEMIQILRDIGYEIVSAEKEGNIKLRKRFINPRDTLFVKQGDELLSIEQVFKMEIVRRLFKVKLEK